MKMVYNLFLKIFELKIFDIKFNSLMIIDFQCRNLIYRVGSKKESHVLLQSRRCKKKYYNCGIFLFNINYGIQNKNHNLSD